MDKVDNNVEYHSIDDDPADIVLGLEVLTSICKVKQEASQEENGKFIVDFKNI